jgi:hypothetical protein
MPHGTHGFFAVHQARDNAVWLAVAIFLASFLAGIGFGLGTQLMKEVIR